MEELDGVDTERSSSGTASRASDGETLGEGEHGRCSGEVTLLAGVLADKSAMLDSYQICYDPRCTTGMLG